MVIFRGQACLCLAESASSPNEEATTPGGFIAAAAHYAATRPEGTCRIYDRDPCSTQDRAELFVRIAAVLAILFFKVLVGQMARMFLRFANA